MNKEMMKFWITCPHCKGKFGVSPAVVIKYVHRLSSAVGDEIRKRSGARGVSSDPVDIAAEREGDDDPSA